MMTKTDLRIKVLGQEQELKNQQEKFSLRFEKLQVENELKISEENRRLAVELEKQTVLASQLKARLDESPYAQLTELLKALVVKLPTLNINELSVKTKEK